MTQEEKELLLKDLCSRLPYGVKISIPELWTSEKKIEVLNEIFKGDDGLFRIGDIGALLEYSKPYLFPLSSITIEQEKELSKLGVSYGEYALHDDIRGLGIMVDEAYIFFEFCYKHHIDVLGLIEKGLAIDATGLNIY